MKHIVYYFSGTGNSLTVAKALEEQGATIISIAAKMEKKLDTSIVCDGDKVGFVFPLYYLGLPKIVHEFMQKLELTKASYVYMICTMGWTLRGGAIKQIKKQLLKSNVKLNMGCYLHMPMNDFTMCTVSEPQKQKAILDQFHKSMNQILAWVNQSKQHFDLEPIGFMVHKRNDPFRNKVAEEDNNFTVTDQCSGCGICTKVCSCKNIEIIDGKPNWKHQCQSCLACFHYCPKHAILYKGKGEEITHYHHPAVSAGELEKYRKAK